MICVYLIRISDDLHEVRWHNFCVITHINLKTSHFEAYDKGETTCYLPSYGKQENSNLILTQ